jgi:hypothetical protein
LGENTGYTFSIFKSTLAPGMGIPLHSHAFAQFFYVLGGNLPMSPTMFGKSISRVHLWLKRCNNLESSRYVRQAVTIPSRFRPGLSGRH